MIMRNEDVQGIEKVFSDYDSALKDAIWAAEKTVISWKEAKSTRYKCGVKIWKPKRWS